ncbi:MAG: NAD(P)-dependent oxidoreductase [Myxococcota bacterium]
MDRTVMGFDLGGGGVRALLLEADSGRTWSASRPWTPRGAPGSSGMGVDVPLDEVWDALGGAARAVREKAGVAPESVAGVAASAMRFGQVVLDDAGEVLLAVPNRDARAALECFQLTAEHGEGLLEAGGIWPVPVMGLSRLLWLRAQQPEAFARATTSFSLGDWITWRLCGERVSDPSQAAAMGALDLAARGWSDEWIERLSLPRALFPRLVESGTRVGTLREEAAGHLGLSPRAAVVVAGADSPCALLGAGSVALGDGAVVSGTTVPVMGVRGDARPDPSGRLWTAPHVVPGTWVVESNGGPMGETLSWTARVLFADAADPVARLFAEASDSPPGAFGLTSTLGVEVMNGREMGLPLGHLALTHLTRPRDERPGRHVARAVVEGLVFGVRANWEQLAAAGGVADTGRLSVCGGLTRSPQWSDWIADVLDRTVEECPVAEATALGAALCAGVGAGLFEDLPAAVRSRPPARPARPDAERASTYAPLYEAWTQAREGTAAARSAAAGQVVPHMLRAVDETARATRGPRLRPKILCAADLDAAGRERLSALGPLEYASFREKMRLLTGPALVEALKGVAVFVTEVDIVDAASLEKLPDLRVVGACRGDAVNVDVAACTAFGIPVLYAPGRNADAVADLTLAFLLMLARKLGPASAFLHGEDVTAGNMGKMGQAFSTLRGHELGGLTVGLVGLGAVGRKVARRLAPFGARVLAADPFASSDAALRAGAERVALDTLLEASDLVSLHAAVTDETRGLIGQAELARMKPGAGLVNTARAALTDEAALVAALESGQLSGAALDTFSVEPPGFDHPLLQHPNVIATPHVGGNTEEVPGHQGRRIAEGLAALLAGERPQAVLNPEVLEDFRWDQPRRMPDPKELRRLAQAPPPSVTDLQRDSGKSAPAQARRGPAPGPRAPAPAPTPAAAGESAEIVARFRSVLATFLDDLARDAALRELAVGSDVVLHFTLPDAGIDFHFGLHDGEVRGVLEAPEEPAAVALRMSAAILDGMLSGTLNAMEAAMQGDIAFTGDTAKAMTLQQLQSDLQRVYLAARERVGAPGDLTALAPATGAPAAASAAPSGTDELRGSIVACVQELFSAELITATGGNVSARIPDRDELWITPSQLFKGDLRPEVLVRIDLDGRSLDPGARSPSSEWSMHCAIYRARPEAKAVVHAHAPHATILANTGLPFLPISTEAAFFGEIPRVPFIMPGTGELAAAVAEAMADSWACLMVNHGLIVAGRSLRRAADMIEIIDRSAEIILGCHAVGREPPTLPDEVVETLRAMGDLVA